MPDNLKTERLVNYSMTPRVNTQILITVKETAETGVTASLFVNDGGNNGGRARLDNLNRETLQILADAVALALNDMGKENKNEH